MDAKKLKEILDKHRKWLNGEEGGEQADLRGANLSEANLSEANLSGATGLLSPGKWMKDNFSHNENGYIVYKTFNAYNGVPSYWTINDKAIIEEEVNFNRTDVCGCGINFATLEWIKNDSKTKKLEIWECLIHWSDAVGVVVPYNTDGKARCSRLELIKKL